MPRWSEVAALLDLAVRAPDSTRALGYCGDVADVRRLARRRVPRMVFDFVDGAAGSESSLRRARGLFGRLEFEPRALRDVRKVDLETDLLGTPSPMPFFLAPTGATRLMNHAGETAVARVAADLGIPYALSTLGTTSVENLAAAVPHGRRWFQLYVMSDRSRGAEMVRRALDTGYDTLLVTVDTPVPGRRNRDTRNGLVTPPKLTWRSIARIAPYPRWWVDALTTEPIRFAMVDADSEMPAARMEKVFDAGVSIRDIEWLREMWPGKLVAKGIQSVHDAELVAGTGIDAVYLSAHGGRQLDNAPLPFELLPVVREAVDRKIQIFVDGGIMTGAEILACLAQGADGVGIGRAYLYGLMAAGEAGVRRVCDILQAELETTLRLVGCTSVSAATDVSGRLRPSG
jgi:L-lactate dehydrogenase (cytochrome)